MERVGVVLFDFPAQEPDELDLHQGDLVQLIQKVNDSWWLGRKDEHTGIFPTTYVEPLLDSKPFSYRESAWSEAEARAKPVMRFLTSIQLEEYALAFVENGYDDLDIIEEISESDLDAIGVVPQEHRRRILGAAALQARSRANTHVDTGRSRANSETVAFDRQRASNADRPQSMFARNTSVGMALPAYNSSPSATRTIRSSSATAVSTKSLKSPRSTSETLQETGLIPIDTPAHAGGDPSVSAPVLATAKEQNLPSRFTGYLAKQGGKNKGWKRRWIVCEGGELKYFKTPQDKEPAGVLRIGEMLQVGIHYNDSRKDPKYSYCFHISTTRSRVFVFSAESEREMLNWIDFLQALIDVKERIEFSDGGREAPAIPSPPPTSEIKDIKEKEEKSRISPANSFSTTSLAGSPSPPRETSPKDQPLLNNQPDRTFDNPQAHGRSMSSPTSLYASGLSAVAQIGRTFKNGTVPLPSKSGRIERKASVDDISQFEAMSLYDDRTPPDKEGWLKKMGNNVQKDWKKRYVVIKGGRLFYFKSYEDFLASTPINLIELITTTAKPLIGSNKCRFELVTIHRSYWFQVETQAEMMDWIIAIQTAIGACLANVQSKSEKGEEHRHNVFGTEALASLREDPANRLCADCSASDPDWACINMGLLICIECSGVHRSMGVQVSKVRSLSLDDWPPESLMLMKAIGNERANSVWEAVPIATKPKPSPSDSREVKSEYILAKYSEKAFLSSEYADMDLAALMKLFSTAISENNLLGAIRLLSRSTPAALLINTVGYLEDGATLLMIAAQHGTVEMVELLLQNGADPTVKNKAGIAPAQLAQESGRDEIFRSISQAASRWRAKEKVEDGADDDEIFWQYRCGFLYKRGETNKFWKRRWFVYEDGVLRYYKLKEDREPAGTIIVSDMVAVTTKEDTSKPHYFELLTRTGRVYELAADNESQMCDWMDVLRLAIDARWAALEFSGKNLNLADFAVSGPVMTREGDETRWRKRWSLLKEKTLYHFANEDRKRLMSSMDLRLLIEVEIEPPPPTLGDKPCYVIILKTNTRTYRIMTETAEACQSWFNAIRSTQIFGLPIEEVARRKQGSHDKGVPLVLVKCIYYLNAYGLEQEGLYRIPGDPVMVKKLRTRFNQDDAIVTLPTAPEPGDVHVVATLLKSYLRELPEPLLTFSLHDELLKTVHIHNEAERYTALKNVLASLPEVNYKTLKKLLNHLVRLLELSEINQMTPEPLAAIFSPNLLREPGRPAEYPNLIEHSVIVLSLLKGYYDIFENGLRPALIRPVSTSHALSDATGEVPTLVQVYVDDGKISFDRSYPVPITTRMTAKEVAYYVSKLVQKDDPKSSCVNYSLFEVVPESERVVDDYEKVLSIISSWKADSGGRLLFKFNVMRKVQLPLNASGFPEVRGWLFKEGSTGTKLWKKRYCILRPEGICYFKDTKNVAVSRGSIPYYGLVVSLLPDRKRAPTRFCFSIHRRWPRSPQEDFRRVFAADSDEQRTLWMTAIRFAKKPRRNSNATLFSWPSQPNSLGSSSRTSNTSAELKSLETTGDEQHGQALERNSLRSKSSSTGSVAPVVLVDNKIAPQEDQIPEIISPTSPREGGDDEEMEDGEDDEEDEDEEVEDDDDDDDDEADRVQEEAEKARALQRQQQVQRISALRRSARVSGERSTRSSFSSSASLIPPPPSLLLPMPPSFVTEVLPADPVNLDEFDELDEAERELYELEQELDHALDFSRLT